LLFQPRLYVAVLILKNNKNMNIAEFYNFVVLAIINKIFALIVIVLQLIIGVVTFTKVGFLNRSLKFVSKLVLVSKIFFLEILYIWFLNKMLTIC